MKSQISIEYILILGFLILVTLPLIYYGISTANKETYDTNTAKMLKEIAIKADKVYALGPGNIEIYRVTVPSNTIDFKIQDNHDIVLTVKLKNSNLDYFSTTTANLTGILPTTPGTYSLRMESYDNATVGFTFT